MELPHIDSDPAHFDRLLAELPRCELALLPTPLQAQPQLLPALLGEPPLHSQWPALYIKRDDLTGSTLTGNKVRKLEYLLGTARAEGADAVVTCGAVQSNHVRATALAAAQLGMRCSALLRVEDPQTPPPLSANALLDALAGAELHYVSRAEYRDRAKYMAQVHAALETRGHKSYLIPEGGSNALGTIGYLRCVAELRAQLPDPEQPATLVYAAGSGGTGAGLLLGVTLLGLPWHVVGVNVCDDRAYFVERIGDILAEAGGRFQLAAAAALSAQRERVIDIRDGYVGRGYALSRPEELQLLQKVCAHSGLVLDPVYTGKAFGGFLSELRRDGFAFGERVIFVHTGGIYGLLAKAPELAELLPHVRRD